MMINDGYETGVTSGVRKGSGWAVVRRAAPEMLGQGSEHTRWCGPGWFRALILLVVGGRKHGEIMSVQFCRLLLYVLTYPIQSNSTRTSVGTALGLDVGRDERLAAVRVNQFGQLAAAFLSLASSSAARCWGHTR